MLVSLRHASPFPYFSEVTDPRVTGQLHRKNRGIKENLREFYIYMYNPGGGAYKIQKGHPLS